MKRDMIVPTLGNRLSVLVQRRSIRVLSTDLIKIRIRQDGVSKEEASTRHKGRQCETVEA